MEDAVLARDAAREAVGDITPEHLREFICSLLDESPVIPGVLTLLSARASDQASSIAGVDDRVAGVQLIYEGLRLTRSLAEAEPWTSDPPHTEDNIAILAADVMVSRGFYLLARTEAADKAVETVQSFGRDQTDGAKTGGRALETDVLELGVIAGTTATGDDVPPELREYAVDLTDSFDDVGRDGTESLPDSLVDALKNLSTHKRKASHVDEVPPSSATDP